MPIWDKPQTTRYRLTISIIASIFFHLIVINGEYIDIPKITQQPTPTLAITFITEKDNPHNNKTQLLANENQTGLKQLSSPPSDMAFQPQQNHQPKEPSIEQQLRIAELAIKQYQQTLARKNQRLKQKKHANQKKVNARKSALANYQIQWDKKVKMVGNLNYPPEARINNIRGKLTLQVILNADGSIQHTEIIQSSGSRLLDLSAIQITTSAAPFPKVPSTLLNQANSLEITRIWTFDSNQHSTSITH